MKRKIVQIDEEKCNGCGLCIPNCAEGAIQIIDGKARLVSDKYCDGLGACLGTCPQGAIKIIEREAEEFDEEATTEHLKNIGRVEETEVSCPTQACPGSKVMLFHKDVAPASTNQPSTLAQWPVQLSLVPVNAPFFENGELLVVADCAPFAYGNFHKDILKCKPIVVGCPKLDDSKFYIGKLSEIFKQNNLKSITVVHMEVPCCFGMVRIVQEALKNSRKDIPYKEVTIGVQGGIVV